MGCSGDAACTGCSFLLVCTQVYVVRRSENSLNVFIIPFQVYFNVKLKFKNINTFLSKMTF